MSTETYLQNIFLKYHQILRLHRTFVWFYERFEISDFRHFCVFFDIFTLCHIDMSNFDTFALEIRFMYRELTRAVLLQCFVIWAVWGSHWLSIVNFILLDIWLKVQPIECKSPNLIGCCVLTWLICVNCSMTQVYLILLLSCTHMCQFCLIL